MLETRTRCGICTAQRPRAAGRRRGGRRPLEPGSVGYRVPAVDGAATTQAALRGQSLRRRDGSRGIAVRRASSTPGGEEDPVSRAWLRSSRPPAGPAPAHRYGPGAGSAARPVCDPRPGPSAAEAVAGRHRRRLCVNGCLALNTKSRHDRRLREGLWCLAGPHRRAHSERRRPHGRGRRSQRRLGCGNAGVTELGSVLDSDTSERT